MEDIVNHLALLGLGTTEAKLYVAGLRCPQAVGVQQLQKMTGLKRPTIYHNLNLLQLKGLVSRVDSLGRGLYSFSDPSQLEHNIQAEVRAARLKLRTLSTVLTGLEDIRTSSTGQTTVRHYEGLQGIKTVVDMALFCTVPQWKVIAPVDNFFRNFDEPYARYYMITRRRHGIVSQTLWEKPVSNGRLLSKQEIKERQPRYLPPVMQKKFNTTTIIFDQKIAMITSLNEQSAVLIESADLANLYSAMFDGLWEHSTPYNEYHAAQKTNL